MLMYDYYLDLVGLKTVLRTPKRLTVTDRLQPFLCQKHTETPQCVITVRVCDRLPAVSPQGLWQGLTCYDFAQGAARIFHRTALEQPPFSATCLEADGNINLYVLQDYAHYFSGTSGIFNRIGMENLLLQHHGMLLHASYIKYKETAILFTGPSGVGKSTQAALWEAHTGARIINGDRAAIRKTTDGWTAWGSPYAGTSGIYRNESAPVGAVVVLGQAQENRLQPLNAAQALRSIYPEVSIHRWDRRFTTEATELLLDLLSHVPVFSLECQPNESAVTLLKEGMQL